MSIYERNRVSDLLDNWEMERVEVDKLVLEFVEWAEVVKRTDKQFAEATSQLNCLTARLSLHFAKEQGIAEQLVTLNPQIADQSQSLLQRTNRDHGIILGRLNALCDRMSEARNEYDSWSKCASDLRSIVVLLEFHEKTNSMEFVS